MIVLWYNYELVIIFCVKIIMMSNMYYNFEKSHQMLAPP